MACGRRSRDRLRRRRLEGDTVIADPLPRLARLPAWWRGAARIRVAEAAEHPSQSDARRRNLLLAAQYERKAAELEAKP
jgi:hypothetical protein